MQFVCAATMAQSQRRCLLGTTTAPSGCHRTWSTDGETMRILFGTNTLEVGGIETNLVRLTRALTGLGHEVTVVSAGGALSQALECAGGVNVCLQMDFRSPGRIWHDVRTLDELLLSSRPDVVHVFSASSAILCAMVQWTRRWRGRPSPPMVGTIMGLMQSAEERRAVTYARAWATSFGASVLLVPSPTIEAAARRLPIARRRIRPAVMIGAELANASLDDARRRLLREELLGEGGTHLVVTAGRLVPAKRHEFFISAAAELVRERPGARFVIVGEGPLREKLAAQIDELGLADVVSLLGTRSDLHDLMRCADVYVRPGLLEGGIGMTVLEAQAACVPVVSFDTQDVRAAITHGVTGWLVPLGDIGRLADAVSSLLSPSDATRQVVAAAHRQAMEIFDIESVAASLVTLYRELGAGRPTPRDPEPEFRGD